jgi:hypothetical protein
MTLGPRGIVVGAARRYPGFANGQYRRTVRGRSEQSSPQASRDIGDSAAVAVLSSEGAAAMTGQVLGADGGFFLR